jgi:hypothetical protein
MFRASSCPSSGAYQMQQRLLIYRRNVVAVLLVMVWPGRPDHDQQHCYHHAPTVKPEAVTAATVLLMMDVRNVKS